MEPQQTFELIEKAKEGDEQAKQILIVENMPLIKSIVRRYRNKGTEYDDLIQLGSMGLLKAINNFNMEFGVRFSTYAVPMITGEIKRFLRDDGYIKVSRSVKSLAGKIAAFVDSYRKQHFCEPRVQQIAKEFNMDVEDVVFAMDASRFPVSLYEKSEEGNERSPSLIDKLSVDNHEDNIDKLFLREFIKALPEKEKKIIMLRYFRDKTQSEISKIMGVSQVQISRIEAKIINKLKNEFSITS